MENKAMKIIPHIWCELETPNGKFRMYDMRNEAVRVVCKGDINDLGEQPLVRMHSSCIASETFGALDCDCADQLTQALTRMETEGSGLIVHLLQEGRGHGLSRKILAVGKMQEDKLDTSDAFEALGWEQDVRRYDPVVSLLESLRISRVRLISNNPRKKKFLEDHGIAVTEVYTNPKVRRQNLVYLHSKNAKLGHKIPLDCDCPKDDRINFYHSQLDWGFLSNLSRHPVCVRGKIWPTVEHFYQAQKFTAESMQEKIRRCKEPIVAKATATRNEWHRRKDWEDIKEDVMIEALRAKFDQHTDLREELLSSGDRRLVEHTKDDKYWGDGGDDTGQNRLGCLLMQVREDIRPGSKSKTSSD